MTTTTLTDTPFVKACRGDEVPFTPVWLMRQAGRYQASYRAIRAKYTFLELCKTPEAAAEVTLLPINEFNLDAAIIFADILLILETMGFDLEFIKGEGPVIHNPIQDATDVDRITEIDIEKLGYVYEAVNLTRDALPSNIPLIGFAGAPFTVISYALEGGKTREFRQTKTFMRRDKGAWHALMERMTDATIQYLNRQIAAGASVVQVFDSWAGTLSPDEYREYLLPHMKSLLAGITPGTPRINFLTGNPSLLPLLKEAGPDVVGVDWRIDLADAWDIVGHDTPVQGNLDPTVLFSEPDVIRAEVKRILDKVNNRPGHIFNLGHGILQHTPVENVAALCDAVHEYSAR
jgi:uroporphyrinogen decarboxylase